MGAPELTLAETLALADEFGLGFVELRSLQKTLDLPSLFPGTEAVRLPHRAVVLLVASSLHVCHAGEDDIASFLRLAVLASRLNAPYVRVFGGGTWGRKMSADELRRGVSVINACRKLLADRAPGVRMLLETHDAFSSSCACQRLNWGLDKPLEILWDSHHTWRKALEHPGETWAALGPLVRHVHYKDSVHTLLNESRSRFVFPGRGDYPTRELLCILEKAGYRGGLSLEWEKLWCPDLPPLREALHAFGEVVLNRFPTSLPQAPAGSDTP